MLATMGTSTEFDTREADVPLDAVTLHGAAALQALIPEWDCLAGASAEPMQSPQWALAAARTLHEGAPLRTVTVRRGADLVAAMVLVERRRGGVRWLEIPGSTVLGEPLRPLAADPAARRALCEALLTQRMPLALSRIDGAEFVAGLRAVARGRAPLVELDGGGCLVVDLTTEPDGYLARCSDARRKVLRRNRRQLANVGALAFESQEPAPHEVEAALRAAFEVEARGWKGDAGSAVLLRPSMFAFFLAFAEHCAVDRRLLIRRLKVGGQVAAVQVAVVQSGRCFDLKIGYDEQFARHSPGLTLSCDCLADGASRGFSAHEFLGLAESWQRGFATRERRLTSLVVYPLNLAGLFALGVDAAGFAWRRARRALARRPDVAEAG